MDLLLEYRVPSHIVGHSLRVAQAGLFLCSCFEEAGLRLDLALVQSAGLLHDITKMPSLAAGEDHALTGARLLGSLGYSAVAEVVRQHVFLDEDTRSRPDINEIHVVHYADKRVMHTTVVGLAERFEDIVSRYGSTAARRARIEELFAESRELEVRIFEKLSIDPARLEALNRVPVQQLTRPGAHSGGLMNITIGTEVSP